MPVLRREASRRLAALAGALGLALAGQAAWAETPAAPDSAAPPGDASQGQDQSQDQGQDQGRDQGEVGGVVVHGSQHDYHYDTFIPPAKKKALDAEAAREAAWREYRDSTPPTGSDPLALSKDYPGLENSVGK